MKKPTDVLRKLEQYIIQLHQQLQVVRKLATPSMLIASESGKNEKMVQSSVLFPESRGALVEEDYQNS